MGAAPFFTAGRGTTAQEAFASAVADAKHEHGHGGYSGTIAEKHAFIVVRATEAQLNHRVALALERLQGELDACRTSTDGRVAMADGGVRTFTPAALVKRIETLEARRQDDDLLRHRALSGLAQDLLRTDSRAFDKRGSALCLEFGPGEWLFFGYAPC